MGALCRGNTAWPLLTCHTSSVSALDSTRLEQRGDASTQKNKKQLAPPVDDACREDERVS